MRRAAIAASMMLVGFALVAAIDVDRADAALGDLVSTQTTTPGGTLPSSSGGPGTPRKVEELGLACTRRPLVLTDVLAQDDRVLLVGSAADDLRGKAVKIIFNAHEQVATATVAVDGKFSTSAPLPPARLRGSARYMAEIGSERSLDLKLVRRLIVEPPTFAHGTVTLVGRELPPLVDPASPLIVLEQLACDKSTIAARFKPSPSGRFHVTFSVPATATAGVFRLIGSVAAKRGEKLGFATASLPLPVLFG